MGWNTAINDEDSTWWYLGKSVQIVYTRVWSTQNSIEIVRRGISLQDIEAQLSEVENDGENQYRSQTSIAKFLAPDTGKSKKGAVVKSWKELNDEKVFGTSGKKKGSVPRVINVVSRMRVTIVRNRHRKPKHFLSHKLQKHEVEVCRDENCQRQKPFWEIQSTAVFTLLEWY